MPVPKGAHACHAIALQPGSKGRKVLLSTLLPIALAPCGQRNQAEVRGQTQAVRRGEPDESEAKACVFPTLGHGLPILEWGYKSLPAYLMGSLEDIDT